MSSIGKEKVFQLLEHPQEIWPTVNLLYRQWSTMNAEEDFDPNEKYCFWILTKVSRSFALVIQELDAEMRKAICIFYLVLRGLDTVEDDMEFPVDRKIPLLRNFHNVLEKRGWNLTDCGENDNERNLMRNFHIVIDQYLGLKKRYRVVIKDITQRMGKGMADFFTSEVNDRVISVKDWNQYCHYVAGLVGIGLSNLFASSTLEDAQFAKLDDLSNSMGLFLQKTNIIRDYYEDMEETRAFWPEEIWKKHAKNLEDFMKPENIKNAVFCLNELITNALEHIPDCFEYLGKLRTKANFSFCAIPQVMAIGTLAHCYNNPQVFSKNPVKMRLGEMSMVFHQTLSMGDVLDQFDHYLEMIQNKLQNPHLDPTSKKTRQLLSKLRSLSSQHKRTKAFSQSYNSSSSSSSSSSSTTTINNIPPVQQIYKPKQKQSVMKTVAGLMFAAGSSYFQHPRKKSFRSKL